MSTSFWEATAVRSLGDGSFEAALSPHWAVGERPHGGYLLAVMARAALTVTGENAPDPLTVSAAFLRPPVFGAAAVTVTVRKKGRTVTAVNAVLEQDGLPCVDAAITCGRLPEGPVHYSDLARLPAEPPAGAIDVTANVGTVFRVGQVSRMMIDAGTAGFLTGRTDLPPRLHLWVKPADHEPDALFALMAGDISPPVVFNTGRYGWSPTVQLTALLRARPAPGWLRVLADSRALHDRWFDEDLQVIDSTGRLVCQARQLAIAPE
jgi:Thioesterase-like superfamily